MHRVRFLVFGAILSLAPTAWAQFRVPAGEVRPYTAGPPRPYPQGNENRPVVWTEIVRSNGATWLRLYFENFNLAPGDYVTVRAPGRQESYRYEGRGLNGNGTFWSFSTEGDTAIVQLHAGNAIGEGFRISKLGHGFEPLPEPTPEIQCGSDGRKDVACYTSPPKSTFNPVARLLFEDSGTFFVCTGWLVAGTVDNLLMTNNHCIDTEPITDTLEARFNYQRQDCRRNSPLETYSTYAGDTMLVTNASLDYTLLTLQGNPEGTWGEFTATTLEPVAGTLMLFPQHPGGGVKKLGKFEDKQQHILCDVTAVNQTFSGTPDGSQFSYGCDSQGGSSGSPILNASSLYVMGLHHFGGVGGGCNNGATHMRDICAADANTYLSCVN